MYPQLVYISRRICTHTGSDGIVFFVVWLSCDRKSRTQLHKGLEIW